MVAERRFAIVPEWMEGENINEFIQRNLNENRIEPVLETVEQCLLEDRSARPGVKEILYYLSGPLT